MNTFHEIGNPLDRFLMPLFGLPAWSVKLGVGSFLTFEFGAPELRVREWHQDGELRRSARARGMWHLWIYCCHWRALQGGLKVAWSEDEDQIISKAIAKFNGQKLVKVSVDPALGYSHFMFDLGGSLETWPYSDVDRNDEQWLFYGPETVFVYRADGHYSQHPGNTPRDLQRWIPLR